MAYATQPLFVRGTIPSAGALAIGAQTNTILASPGAGLAYRVVAVGYMCTRAFTGHVELNVQDSGLIAVWRAGLSWASSAAWGMTLPEPGYTFLANSSLVLQAISDAANGTAECWLHYFVDAVS